jgi:hypothetical protein
VTRPHEEEREFSEERASLARITLAPAVWAVHFVLSYASTAVYCSRWGEGEATIQAFRIAIAVGTLVALAMIGWLGWRGWRQWDSRVGRSGLQVLEDLVEEHEERHEFLGHAAMLLAIISFDGVIYTSLPVALIGSCR